MGAAADDFDEQHEKLSSEAVSLMNKIGVETGLMAHPPSPRTFNVSIPSPRQARQLELPEHKQQAASLWPPPLEDHRLKLLPDQQYLKALFAIRSNRFPIQPLRFGMQVSPRSRFNGLARCHLENDGSGEGPPGGPWALEDRVVELGDGVQDEVEQPVKRAWKLQESIWWPRRKWADSRDLYDTAECLRKALQADWKMASSGGGLEKFIVKYHKAAEPSCADVVEYVLSTLDDHNETIYSIFDAYALQGTGDFTHIQINAYKDFLMDCEMVEEGSEGLNAARWDELFVAINATTDAEDRYNHKKGFNRQEWIDFIVRAAIMRYCQYGDMTDVVAAVETLITEDFVPSVRKDQPLFLETANAFRRKYCYIEETSEVLRRHEASLRCIFEQYAYGQGAIGDAFDSKLQLGFEEYRDMLLDFGVIDSQFVEREANWSFVSARMRVIKEHTEKGRAKLLQLSFEDFLESLVRIATVKAMPDKEDVASAGCVDAGDYLFKLNKEGGVPLKAFLSSHSFPQGAPPPQPIGHAVDALVTFLVRTIMVTSGGKAVDARDPKVSAADCKAFIQNGGVRRQSAANTEGEVEGEAPPPAADEVEES